MSCAGGECHLLVIDAGASKWVVYLCLRANNHHVLNVFLGYSMKMPMFCNGSFWLLDTSKEPAIGVCLVNLWPRYSMSWVMASWLFRDPQDSHVIHYKNENIDIGWSMSRHGENVHLHSAFGMFTGIRLLHHFHTSSLLLKLMFTLLLLI